MLPFCCILIESLESYLWFMMCTCLCEQVPGILLQHAEHRAYQNNTKTCLQGSKARSVPYYCTHSL